MEAPVKKYLIVFGALICLAVLGISAGGMLGGTTTSNINLTYPTEKGAGTFTKTEMMDFNNVKYEVRGNTIILNKKDLFQNREITFSETQTCLDYNEPTCIEWNPQDCLEYETRKPIVCLKLENPEDEKSNCIEWEQPKDCIDWDAKTGTCLKYENELSCLKWSELTCKTMSERTCINWTKFTREDFIAQRIKQEIEFVKGIQIARANKTVQQVDINGKVVIK